MLGQQLHPPIFLLAGFLTGCATLGPVFESKETRTLKVALKRDWENQKKKINVWTEKGGNCAEIEKQSACSNDSDPKFEKYELEDPDLGTLIVDRTALYCPREKKYWVIEDSIGCFGGPQCRSFGPFILNEEPIEMTAHK